LSGELLQHVCELSQERYARLLKVRKESHSRLKLVDFVKMNASVNEFVRDVDHLCKRPFSVLGAELQAHAAEFLRVAHEAATRKLEALVETEPWKQVDVAPEFQDIADSFVHHQVPQLAESELERLREHEAPAESAGTPREILVEGVGYKVVGSSLLLLTMIAHYMQCVAALQTVGPQVAHLAPALLKLFHTLCYKQVLMAGAMRPESAGLKSITFKHLALASQSLGLFLGLMPHLKAILAAYLPEAQRALLREADSAIADYERHQQELFSKFVSILEERRRTHVSTLADALAPSEDRRRPEPSACIKAVAKDIVSMHKQLQPLLSRQQLHTVFVQVLHAFDGGLLGSYKALDTSALFTRQCIVADVLYLRQEVTRLHLALPKGVCPDLIEFAKSLDVSG
jgi:vacuolar protein sorting-associated protein 54